MNESNNFKTAKYRSTLATRTGLEKFAAIKVQPRKEFGAEIRSTNGDSPLAHSPFVDRISGPGISATKSQQKSFKTQQRNITGLFSACTFIATAFFNKAAHWPYKRTKGAYSCQCTKVYFLSPFLIRSNSNKIVMMKRKCIECRTFSRIWNVFFPNFRQIFIWILLKYYTRWR